VYERAVYVGLSSSDTIFSLQRISRDFLAGESCSTRIWFPLSSRGKYKIEEVGCDEIAVFEGGFGVFKASDSKGLERHVWRTLPP
jgi:hypothetical protein